MYLLWLNVKSLLSDELNIIKLELTILFEDQ